MKRITPAEVQDAFDRFALMAVDGEFFLFDDEGRLACACPLGALYVAAGNEMPSEEGGSDSAAHKWARGVYGESYVGGFVAGFDELRRDASGYTDKERYSQGFADGQAVRAATEFATEVSRG